MFWASPGPFGAFEKWASANPEAQVFLWYDSAQTTSHVVEASNAVLKEQLATHKIGNLHLRDVREITIVRSNPDCFSDQIPVYFRIDVLKAIIIVHSIEREGMDSAIFSDLEVGDRRPDHSRMGKAELFNAQFMRLLQRQGLLLNTNTNGIENQFLQLVKNARMIAAIKIAIVNVNLLRATTGLNAHDDAFIVGLARAPYRSMLEDVFAYYYGTEPGLHILVDPRIVRRGQAGDPWIEFQPTVQGYEPFGLYYSYRSGALQPDPDHPERWLTPNQMLRFPADSGYGQVPEGRGVAVRSGRDHGSYEFDEVRRPPAAGGEIYHCVLW